MADAATVAFYGPELIERLRIYADFEDNDDWREVVTSFTTVGAPTAYVFRCCHCGALGGYWDCD